MPKKRGARKKKTASGGGSMLATDLKDHVKNTLKYWQANFGRAGIRQKIVNMLDPSQMNTDLLQMMFARTQEYNGLLQAAKNNNELKAGVMPFMAAIAFESVFQACAAFWLVAGDPPAPNELKKTVEDFIDLQVETFSACLKA